MLTSSLCLCFEAVLGVIAGGLVLLLPETKGRVLPETVEDVENFHRWVTMINLQQFSLAIQQNPCPEGILGVTCLPCWFPRSCWVVSRFWLDKFRIAALVSQMSCSTIINGICVKKKKKKTLKIEQKKGSLDSSFACGAGSASIFWGARANLRECIWSFSWGKAEQVKNLKL